MRTLILCLVLSNLVSATWGAAIRGRLLDAGSNIYLQGVEAKIVETGQSVFTERGGNFRFSGVEVGQYTVEAQPMGFPSTRQQVTISAPDDEVYVLLEVGGDDIYELEAVAVTAGVLGQAKAMNIQRSSDSLVNVVSSDAFGEFVDRNAAEALQRVVGVTVSDDQGEGKFVIIRGAAPGLSTVSIDGVQVATPEEGGRSTGLNLIAIDQLESIELTKSWLPRQPANFIGGAVNLITRSALDRDGQFMSVDVGYGEYTVSEEASRKLSAVYGNVWGGDRIKFGFQVSVNESVDHRGSESANVGSWYARVNLGLKDSVDGFRANDLILEDYDIERKREGASTKLELQINNRHTFEFSASVNRFDNDEVTQSKQYNPSNAQHLYYGTKTYTTAVAQQLGHDLNDPAVQARLTHPVPQERLLTVAEAMQIDLGYDQVRKVFTHTIFNGDSQYRQWRAALIQDQITTMQFGGRHEFSDAWSLNYKVHQSEAEKDEHRQVIRMSTGQKESVIELIGNLTVMRNPNNQINDPFLYSVGQGAGFLQDNFLHSDDKRSGAELNIIYKWITGKISHQTETGGYYDTREKGFARDYRQYSNFGRTGGGQRLFLSDPFIYGGMQEEFLREYPGYYDFGPIFNTEVTREFVNAPSIHGVNFQQTVNDITVSISDALLRDYEASEDVNAFYLMHSADIGRLKLIGGVRYEKTENTFTNNNILTRNPDLPGALGRDLILPNRWKAIIDHPDFGVDSLVVPSTTGREYDNWLGALHGIYRLNDQLVIRSAVTQTIARPDYTDLVPREIPGVSGGQFSTSVQLPNFNLMPLESVNYDLSMDYYFKGFGYISLGAFYKDLDGPIYTELNTTEDGEPLWDYLTGKFVTNPTVFSENWSTQRRVNAGKGKLYGLEFAYEQKFSMLPGLLSGLGMTVNFALMESEVSLPSSYTSGGTATSVDRTGEKLPLFEQPDKLANLSLFWEKHGLLIRASLLYKGTHMGSTTVTGVRIQELATLGLPLNSYDTFVKDSLRLDLLVRYRLPWGFSIYFEGTNLTNEPYITYYGEEWRMNTVRHTRPIYFVGMRWAY